MESELKYEHDPNVCEEWSKNIEKVIFTEKDIAKRVGELAKEIQKDYEGKGKILIVGLLTGAMVFTADLLRKLPLRYDVDFMVLSSYGHSTSSSGSIKLKKDLSIDPAGRHVLIVEDLIDTGNTLEWLQGHLKSKKCKSVKICCLLDKISRRTANVAIDYSGFECPDEFVVGYGMDFADEYRCLPFVGVLKPEAYQ